MSCTRTHCTIVRNGKRLLTSRTKKIISHYRRLGVNVESVLERESERLSEDILIYKLIGKNFNHLKEKVDILQDILCVLNS